jgi:hypothetical protein
MDYRLYLFDLRGEIAAAVPFLAGDDLEAMELGALILRESRDVFSKHEVWSGVRHLTGSNLVVLSLGVQQMPDARQRRVAEIEMNLASSFACIRRSQLLLEALDDMEHSPVIDGIRKLAADIRRDDRAYLRDVPV